MSLRPLKLFHKGASPNPWKVLIIVEELGLPYKLINVVNVKSPEFLAINPNGRVPALEDLNSGVTTWESGAIIDYLIDTYDSKHIISYASLPEKFTARNWVHLQMSGQGPSYGQKMWFSKFHPEKIQSAIDRYANETKRLLGVVELQLSTTGQPYLVGSKATYADLMFVPWNEMLPVLLGPEFDFKGEFPKTYEWHQKLLARDGVKRMLAAKAEAVGGK